jgi:hypothetical protein
MDDVCVGAYIPLYLIIARSEHYQPGLENPSRISLKEKHPMKRHISYVRGMVKKLCITQEILDSNLADS